MTDLVSEMQAKSLEPQTSVTDLLRIAKVVAVKLGLDEFLAWIESELGGYEASEVPSYRVLQGEMKARNPFHGLVPVNFPNDELATLCKTVKLHQKISEVEKLSHSTESKLYIPISDATQQLLQNFFGQNMQFMLLFSPVTLSGIVDAVRNVILDWSLKLEKNGIKGDGMTFSKEDRVKAQAPGVVYQINSIENFTGNMGGVSGQGVVNATTRIGVDSQALAKLIGQLEGSKGQFGLSTDKQLELEKTLAELKALNSSKPNSSKLGALLGVAKTIIQNAGSSLLIQGALFEIDKFKHLIQT
jgi:hypothetical protein